MATEANSDRLNEQPTEYLPPPETQRLIDELYREEILEARAMSPEDKIRAGQQLFEAACRVTLAGIRNQNPGISEERCLEILRQRLDLQRRLEESSYYEFWGSSRATSGLGAWKFALHFHA